MELTIDIPEKDLAELGKETIQQEIAKTLKWLRIRQSFKKVSDGLKEIDKKSHQKQVETIRASSWEEYKT